MAEYIRKAEIILALRDKGLIFDEIAKAISALPAADVAPVKHGKWEYHYSRPGVYADVALHCSSCEGWVRDIHPRFYYCPWCGAKMEDATDE